MVEETETITLDSGVPKCRRLAVLLGGGTLIFIVAYFITVSSMFGYRINELGAVRTVGFASTTVILIVLSKRFADQFLREVLTLKHGILTHEEHHFWMKRRYSLVNDVVQRLEIRISPYSFTIRAVTVNGSRIVARDIALSRKEEYLHDLAQFAPVSTIRGSDQGVDLNT